MMSFLRNIVSIVKQIANIYFRSIQHSLGLPEKQGQALQVLSKSPTTRSKPSREPFNVWASRHGNSLLETTALQNFETPENAILMYGVESRDSLIYKPQPFPLFMFS